MVEYANVIASRVSGNPMPRLDRMGYTLRSGSPTGWMVRIEGCNRWLRVYCLQFGNAASFIVKTKGKTLFVRESVWELDELQKYPENNLDKK